MQDSRVYTAKGGGDLVALTSAAPASGTLIARSTEIPKWIAFTRSDRELAARLEDVLLELPAERPLLVFGKASRAMVGASLLIEIGARMAVEAADVAAGGTREADGLRELAAASGSDVVVGVGGGRTLDVAKYAAFKAQVPFVAVPTQASHDGIASPVAILSGTKDDTVDSYGARPPSALVVPMHVIEHAPRRTVVSGIGDLAANSLAVSDWRWAREAHHEEFDDYAALLGRTAAELIIARRELYSASVPFQPEDVEMLVNGLVVSGLAMTVCGSSRPCSGSEHLISHAFDRLGLGHGLHGEQVAIGIVLAARFHDDSFSRVLDLLRSVGAPTSPAQIGINEHDGMRAVQTVPYVRPGRKCVLTQALEADPALVLDEARDAWFSSS